MYKAEDHLSTRDDNDLDWHAKYSDRKHVNGYSSNDGESDGYIDSTITIPQGNAGDKERWGKYDLLELWDLAETYAEVSPAL